MFLFPMWDNESQRIGKQKCTPLGYQLHVIAELLGFIGLLMLLGFGVYLGYRGVTRTFHAVLLWLMAAPFGMALVSQAIYQFSWVLAVRKGFEYDYDKREASWIEDGQRVVYRYSPQDGAAP